MVSHKTMLACLVCFCAGFSLAAGQTPTSNDTTDSRVVELIRKLGSSSFVQRENACKELQAIGTSALEALRHASRSSDLETKRRIADLIRRFEEQLLTKQVLAPKEIQLKLTDATLEEAIAELSKSYPVQFQGDRTLFLGKKFTLDTGKRSFWQALDQFCDQAGLIEKIDVPAAPPTTYTTIRGKGRLTRINMGTPPPPGPIVLTSRGDGSHADGWETDTVKFKSRADEKTLTSYAGAIKSQLRISRDAATKDLLLAFVISAEPRLANTSLEGRPIFEKALDQKQQQVTALLRPKTVETTSSDGGALPQGAYVLQSFPQRRQTQIRIKEGEISAKLLQELAGKLALQVDLPNEVIAKVGKVLQASGKTTTSANGGTLSVHSVRKIGEDVEVQVTLENVITNPFGGNILVNGGNVVIRGNVVVRNMVVGRGGVRIAGADNHQDLPDLVDAKGQKYQVAQVNSDGVNLVNGSYSRTATILFRPNSQQAEPTELVLFGTRTYTIAVPFRFENVPLP